MSSSRHPPAYWPSVPAPIASSTSRVQKVEPTHSTTWPGHCSIHSMRWPTAYACVEACSTSSSVARMEASHSPSQRSTAPPAALGLKGRAKGTRSPSSLTIAVT